MRGSWKGLFVFSTVLALIHVVAIWTKRNLIFLLIRFNLKIWGSCSKSILCKVPNFLGKSTFDLKTNNSALAVKWQMGLANALPSHGPGNEETSPRETPREFSVLRKPPDHSRRHLRGKLRIAGKCDGVFKQNEPQERLNSLFSCLGSSVKDP